MDKKLDKAGVVCSGVCALHCVMGAVLALFSPLIASYLEHPIIHVSLLVVIAPIALLSFNRGRLCHRKNLPTYLGTLGVLFLLVAVMIKLQLDAEIAETLETTISIMGSLLLITAHGLNMTIQRTAKKH